MRFSIMPRGDAFFILLQESSANLKAVTAALLDLMQNYENVPAKVDEIKRINDTKFIFAERRISSIDIKITIKFFLFKKTPISPIVNIIIERYR